MFWYSDGVCISPLWFLPSDPVDGDFMYRKEKRLWGRIAIRQRFFQRSTNGYFTVNKGQGKLDISRCVLNFPSNPSDEMTMDIGL
jgi:hypothetical protein